MFCNFFYFISFSYYYKIFVLNFNSERIYKFYLCIFVQFYFFNVSFVQNGRKIINHTTCRLKTVQKKKNQNNTQMWISKERSCNIKDKSQTCPESLEKCNKYKNSGKLSSCKFCGWFCCRFIAAFNRFINYTHTHTYTYIYTKRVFLPTQPSLFFQ